MPKIFKNTSFTERDRETTNLVYAVGETAPGKKWQQTNEFDGADIDNIQFPAGIRHLYTLCGVRFFGYL